METAETNRFMRIGMTALLAGLLCALAVCAAPHEAQAVTKTGNGVYWLEPDLQDSLTDTYKKADVTGDKKRDKIQLSVDSKYVSQHTVTTLKVNGKTVKTWNAQKYDVTVCVVTLSNKRSFLEISESSNSGLSNGVLVHKLYRVKNGKLKSVCNLQKFVDAKTLAKYRGGMNVAKVKKNTVCVKAYFNTKALGYVRSSGALLTMQTPSYLQLAYSNGKFKLKAASAKADDSDIFTAAKKIKTTKKVGSKKAGVSIAKDKTFTLKRMMVKGKKLYVQVKAKESGKTGWVKLGKTKLVKDLAL